jgi:hypothetical protein
MAVGQGTFTGSFAIGSGINAVLWNSSGTALNLNPATYSESGAPSISRDSSQIVGTVSMGSYPANPPQAAVWNNVGGNWVATNLAPSTGSYTISGAFATDGTQQGGYISNTINSNAALWFGTAASFVDLNPPDAVSSDIFSVANGKQFGEIELADGDVHATLWSGNAASAIDLNNPSYADSESLATNGTEEIGIVNGNIPIVWEGSASVFTNLDFYVPYGFTNLTICSIDAQGDVFGTAESGGASYAVELVPSPEPASLSLIGAVATFAMTRRRRCA